MIASFISGCSKKGKMSWYQWQVSSLSNPIDKLSNNDNDYLRNISLSFYYISWLSQIRVTQLFNIITPFCLFIDKVGDLWKMVEICISVSLIFHCDWGNHNLYFDQPITKGLLMQANYRYWMCRMNSSLSSMRKDFNHLCHLFHKMMKNGHIIMFSKIIQHTKS